MPDYGLTPQGFVRKRLDVIVDEIHGDLSTAWGINTKLNPASYLNVLVTAFADKVAELWEVAEDNYHSMYPSSAEDISLDNASQFGGSTRENPAKTYYPMHCTGLDGTTLAAGTLVASNTNPPISFAATEDSLITRESFNKASISVVTVADHTDYSVALNNNLYTYTSGAGATAAAILAGLVAAITDDEYQATYDAPNRLVRIEALNIQSRNTLVLTTNLTTANVTSIINFASEEYGEVVLPNGAITVIVRAVPGFLSCVNLSGYIAGRLRETDAEFRRNYANKIFSRSSRMLSSIESAILSKVQGIKSVKAYENDTNEEDDYGRWPHSIEVVVEGGSDTEIATQILHTKAGGISTYGSIEVEIPGESSENITIRFNRPQHVYCWFSASITISHSQSLPANYADLIKAIIIARVDGLVSGGDVTPQRYIAEIYAAVSGIDYIEILVYANTDSSAPPPPVFTDRSVIISPRQLAVTSEARIEVTLNE